MDENVFQEMDIELLPEEQSVTSIFFDTPKASLLVLVEDQDDVPFWHRMFACVADKYQSVDVFTLKQASASQRAQLDAQGNLLVATGKNALMKVRQLGRHKVVAVDADYDLLIDYHTYSDRVRTDTYVIHTEYYSIENHLLTPDTIQRLSLWDEVPAEPMPDWQEVSEAFGSAVANPVKWVIASHEKREKAYRLNPSATNMPSCIDVKDVHAVFADINFAPAAYKASLVEAEKRMTNDCKPIVDTCTIELLPYEDWTPQDALHHVQGHTLYAFLSKAIEYYYQRGYTKLETERKSNVSDSSDFSSVIQSLKEEKGVTAGLTSHIKKVIFRADALDMSDVALQTIQNNIKRISL
jgi:hypothetical protein